MQATFGKRQQDNIETAIRLYENARDLNDEDRWLDLLTMALQRAVTLPEEEQNDETRSAKRKATLRKIQEQIHLRKKGKISRYTLAREIRRTCIEISIKQSRFRPLL